MAMLPVQRDVANLLGLGFRPRSLILEAMLLAIWLSAPKEQV